MPKRSHIPIGFLMKQLTAVWQNYQYNAFRDFAKLQLAKRTFNLRHPFGAQDGYGDSLHLVGVRITDMCNLRCHSCGQWGDNGYLLNKSLKELKQREVPASVYMRLADQIVEAGWSPIWYFWGGEPMLYPGLFELMEYIHKLGMQITLVTNATRVAENADKVADYCQVFYISVDGPDAKTHNTQRPGVSSNHDNFKVVEAALVEVKKEKERRGSIFPFIVPLTTITKYNVEKLVDVYDFTSQYADIHVFYLAWWIDEISAKEHAEDFQERFGFAPTTHYGWIGSWKDFDHDLVYESYQKLLKRFSENKRCLPTFMPRLNSSQDIKEYYTNHKATFGYDQCVSIFSTIEIDSNGDVSLCRDYHDYTIGNIKNNTIQEMWNNEKAQAFRRSISTKGPMPVCRRCCGLMGF